MKALLKMKKLDIQELKNIMFDPLNFAAIVSGLDASTWLNEKTMATYRERMKKLYYDPSKYDTYLEQLGIQYPTVR